MAIQSSSLPLQYMLSSTPSSRHSSHPNLSILCRSAISGQGSLNLRSRSMRTRGPLHHLRPINAIEEEKEKQEIPTFETESNGAGSEDANPSGGGEIELTEMKEAIKARREREGERGGDLWGGVVEETREIEWPTFGKVVGTTGVVLGIIAGSSVVLLTVNAVFAELSDRVFAGRGVQDFFS